MSGFDAIQPDVLGMLQSRQPTTAPTVGEPVRQGDDKPAARIASSGSSSEFSDALMRALGSVKDLSDDVKHKAESLARGEPVELHDLFIASGKSDVAFNLMLEVRNKLLEAWQAISRSA